MNNVKVESINKLLDWMDEYEVKDSKSNQQILSSVQQIELLIEK